MSDTDSTPVIVLAFANDQDDYLKMIVRERKGLVKALREYDDRRYIKLYQEANTSIEDIFEVFNRYPERIAVFHYGGHASGRFLQLEAVAGQAELAHAGGLAQLMGQHKGLQLVFLNGCATQGQVQTLLACGVKAVIATAVPIDDEMATEFAEQFYLSLANKATIGRAFQTARAFVATRYGRDKEVGEFRAINWPGAKKGPVDAGLTWGLYVNDNGEEALAWKLPEVPEHQVIIRGALRSSKSGPPLNDGLIEVLLNAAAKHSKKIRQSLSEDKDSDDYDPRIFPQLIVDSFPAPVGEQLRKLFAGSTIDVQRLRQLVLTYETIAKLFCFAALSQLWNARHDDPALRPADEDWAACNSFMALTPDSQATFDYFKLIVAVVGIFNENHIAPFMAECAELETELGKDEPVLAHRFMEEMRAELQRGKVAAEEVESFCVQAERHLGTLLAHFAFVVRYKLSTIKSIDIIKSRHKPPQFVHNQVLLDRVTAGMKDSTRTYAAFTDSESVILQKDRSDVSAYLNLTPFIVDENALTGQQNSKLYFYSHYDETDDTYHYRSVNDADDRLTVSDAKYPQVKALFDDFKQTVFKT